MRLLSFLALGLASTVAAAGFVPNLKQLDVVPLHALPLQSVQKSIAEAAKPKAGSPLQIGVLAPLNLGLDSGLWDEPEPGLARWRLRVFSADAEWLNLLLQDFHMPAGGELWFYDAEGQRVQGPYTDANNSDDGILSTSPVFSETAVLEVRLPAAKRREFSLRIGEAGHGIRNYLKAGTGRAGSCERDAACPEGASFGNEARSVARLIVTVSSACDASAAGMYFCTGTLMNNARQDNDPLLLTANHCLVNACTAPALSIDWNLQKSGCGGVDDSPNQSQSGADLVRRSTVTGADFSLVRLRQNPQSIITISPKPYLAGWDARKLGSNNGFSFHHPAGDVRKISTHNTALTEVNDQCIDSGACTLRVDGWRVVWNSGVTEGGSSGSGLWNSNRRLIGTLSGGASACDNPVTVTVNEETQPDFYARLDRAWCLGLKEGLDPGNSGITTLDGRNATSGAAASGSTPVSCGTSGGGSGGSGGGNSATAGGGGGGSMSLWGLISLLLLRRLRPWARPVHA